MKRDALQFAGWMALLYAAIAGLCAGCYQPPTPGPAPDPAPVNQSTVERAAADSFKTYRTNLADTAASMRGRIGDSKTYGDFFAAWEKENAAVRGRSLEPYAEAINAALFSKAADGSWVTDGPIDRPKLEQVLRDAESGLRGK